MFLCGISAMLFCLSCEKTDDKSGYEGGEYVESDEYSFCITFGTMPTLYAGLYAVDKEVPTYVFYERTQTFNAEGYPDHVEICPYMGEAEEEQMRDWMKTTIKAIDEKNPDATFNLYVDDLRAGVISHEFFADQGIDISRVKVYMLSDGTGTYNEFYNNFGTSGTGEAYWKKMVDEINSLSWGSDDDEFIDTKALPDFEAHWHWSYPLSTREGFTLVLHDKALLEPQTEDEYVKARIQEMHCDDKNVVDMFNALSPDKQKQFLAMVPYEKEVFEKLMEESPKPNLIINGTNGQPENQRKYVEEVYNKYKEQYDVFFEPHPADESYFDYEEAFPGLKNVPKMSFEFVLMFISDKIDAIGGFPSTIYLTVPVNKVKFMFAAGPEAMPRPLNIVFANAPDGQIDYMLAD